MVHAASPTPAPAPSGESDADSTRRPSGSVSHARRIAEEALEAARVAVNDARRAVDALDLMAQSEADALLEELKAVEIAARKAMLLSEWLSNTQSGDQPLPPVFRIVDPAHAETVITEGTTSLSPCPAAPA